MSPPRPQSAGARPRAALLALAVAMTGAAIATIPGGCTTASRREAYFKSRSDVVAGAAGSGEIRVATWPLTWAEDTALAFRDPARLTDVASPVTPVD